MGIDNNKQDTRYFNEYIGLVVAMMETESEIFLNIRLPYHRQWLLVDMLMRYSYLDIDFLAEQLSLSTETLRFVRQKKILLEKEKVDELVSYVDITLSN